MSSLRTVTATFDANLVWLTVVVNGQGLVTDTTSNIYCSATCTTYFPSGTVLTLSAHPDDWWFFIGWSGPCTNPGNCIVTLTSSATVTATFWT